MATGLPGRAGTSAAPDGDTWLRRRRARAQLLDGAATSVVGVVRRLLAVQAQDPRAAGLAVRARCPGATAAGLGRAIAGDRSLVCGWLVRGTLHLVGRDDYAWLLGLCAPTRLATSRRRLAQEGVSPAQADRAVELIGTALAADGPLRRTELADRLEAADIPTAGQATTHLLMLSALRGVAVVGPRLDGELSLALTSDWLGAPLAGGLDAADRDRALAELARRYLAGHAPATPADLAAWAGLPLRDVRAGLGRLGDELVESDGELLELGGDRVDPQPLGARLLPAFDPYMLGWRDRTFAVAAVHQRRVHPGGGMLRAVAAVDGQVVGTWGARRRDGLLRVELSPFAEPSGDLARELAVEAADVARFEARRLEPGPAGGSDT